MLLKDIAIIDSRYSGHDRTSAAFVRRLPRDVLHLYSAADNREQCLWCLPQAAGLVKKAGQRQVDWCSKGKAHTASREHEGMWRDLPRGVGHMGQKALFIVVHYK